MNGVGRKRWVIAEGYIPGASTGQGRAFESHETACILNARSRDANVRITLFFADRDRVGPCTSRRPGDGPGADPRRRAAAVCGKGS
jgi:hypothetical protein